MTIGSGIAVLGIWLSVSGATAACAAWCSDPKIAAGVGILGFLCALVATISTIASENGSASAADVEGAEETRSVS